MKCVTVREVAQRLGMRYKSAHKLLKRLEKRGLLFKKFVGRVAMYCGDAVESLLNKKRNGKVKVLDRLVTARALLQREGCVSTYALAKSLGADSEEARYVALQLVEGREAVFVVIGRTAIWCRSRAEAEALVERLRETVHRLALSNNMKYATPSKILCAAQRDRDAYLLFSKFIKLSRIDDRLSAVTLAFADGILRLLYGEPMSHMRRKTVYFVSQPLTLEVDIRENIDKKTVSINIPDDLVTALQGVDVKDSVLQAIEQLLARYRP